MLMLSLLGFVHGRRRDDPATIDEPVQHHNAPAASPLISSNA